MDWFPGVVAVLAVAAAVALVVKGWDVRLVAGVAVGRAMVREIDATLPRAAHAVPDGLIDLIVDDGSHDGSVGI